MNTHIMEQKLVLIFHKEDSQTELHGTPALPFTIHSVAAQRETLKRPESQFYPLPSPPSLKSRSLAAPLQASAHDLAEHLIQLPHSQTSQHAHV